MLHGVKVLRSPEDSGGAGAKPDSGSDADKVKAELAAKENALKEAQAKLDAIKAKEAQALKDEETKKISDIDALRKAIAERDKQLEESQKALSSWREKETTRAVGIAKELPEELATILLDCKDSMDSEKWVDMVEKAAKTAKPKDGNNAPPGGSIGRGGEKKMGISKSAAEILENIMTRDPEKRERIMKNINKESRRDEATGAAVNVFSQSVQNLIGNMNKAKVKYKGQ